MRKYTYTTSIHHVSESKMVSAMDDIHEEYCGKCGAKIDFGRRVDFTLKDGTRVCQACFVKETPRPTAPKNDFPD
jgi:RNase P subunit RPR2